MVEWIEKDELEINLQRKDWVRYSDKYLKDLIESIRNNGFDESQPLIVRRKRNGKYEIIDGARRFLAGIKAGMIWFPCKIVNYNDVELRFLEYNITRYDLSTFELAEIIGEIYKKELEWKGTWSKLSEKVRYVYERQRQQKQMTFGVTNVGNDFIYKKILEISEKIMNRVRRIKLRQ